MNMKIDIESITGISQEKENEQVLDKLQGVDPELAQKYAKLLKNVEAAKAKKRSEENVAHEHLSEKPDSVVSPAMLQGAYRNEKRQRLIMDEDDA